MIEQPEGKPKGRESAGEILTPEQKAVGSFKRFWSGKKMRFSWTCC